MTLRDWLDRFERLATPGAYPYSHVYDGGEHGEHVVFSLMIHGNETGSLPAAVRLLEQLRDGSVRFGGRLTLTLGNPEAGLSEQRFLDRDLNRLFARPRDPSSHEGRRVQHLEPLFESADWFIDFHQTILASATPFYIGPYSDAAWKLARAVAATSVWITFHRTSGIGCADEFAANRGIPAITLELGEKGLNPDSERVAFDAMLRTLELVDGIVSGQTTLQQAAESQEELVFWHTVHREPCPSADLRLAPGWINFQPVQRGQRLSAEGSPELIAPVDGAVLFPKYFDPARELPVEIYRIVQPMAEHPASVYNGADS